MKRLAEHKYSQQEQEGASSLVSVCPYGVSEIGKRCAWLAGWHDAHAELDNTHPATYSDANE